MVCQLRLSQIWAKCALTAADLSLPCAHSSVIGSARDQHLLLHNTVQILTSAVFHNAAQIYTGILQYCTMHRYILLLTKCNQPWILHWIVLHRYILDYIALLRYILVPTERNICFALLQHYTAYIRFSAWLNSVMQNYYLHLPFWRMHHPILLSHVCIYTMQRNCSQQVVCQHLLQLSTRKHCNAFCSTPQCIKVCITVLCSAFHFQG